MVIYVQVRYDDSTQHNFADFYDYRSSYPDAEEAERMGENIEPVDPELLISDGFELVLPSGEWIKSLIFSLSVLPFILRVYFFFTPVAVFLLRILEQPQFVFEGAHIL